MWLDLFITWNPEPIAFHLITFPIRWYSLCWVVALLSGYFIMDKLYKQAKIPEDVFAPLFLYCFIGIIVGARLGHCLFYEPGYYLTHLTEMFLPIRQFPDGWRVVGYEGLASHGGVLGLLVAIWLYCRKVGMRFLRVLDFMGITAPIPAAFIRLGNFMNSEIVGQPTDMPWGIVFAANGESFARHPAQLYEALFYILVFVVVLYLYNIPSLKKKIGQGFFFGYCVFTIFAFRFVIEFIKADQVESEANMLLNIGQLLSIPLAIVGFYCMIGGKYCKKFAEKEGEKIYQLPKSKK